MSKLWEENVLLRTSQAIVDGKLRDGRTDTVRKPRTKQYFALHAMSKIVRINVAQFRERFFLSRAIRVKPPRIIPQTLIGDLILSKLRNLLIVTEEGVQDRSLLRQIWIQRRADNTQSTALRSAVDIHPL